MTFSIPPKYLPCLANVVYECPLANHVGLILCMTRKYSVKNGLCEARMVWGRGRGGYLFFSAGHKVVYIHRVFEPPTCPSAKSLRLGRTFHFCTLLSKTPLLLLLVFFIYCVIKSAFDSTFCHQLYA